MQRASEGLHIDRVFTNLRLTGGKPADPVRLTYNPPDLWVSGGGLFEKETIFLSNLRVFNGIIYGNIFSDHIMVDTVAEAYSGSGIKVLSDVFMQPATTLTVDTIQSWMGDDLFLRTLPTNRINVFSDGIDMNCNNIYNVSNILNVVCPDLVIASSNIIMHAPTSITLDTQDFNVDASNVVVNASNDITLNTTNVVMNGNLIAGSSGSLTLTGNIDILGNLRLKDLYVQTIHGFSPVNFNDIASFGKGANFKQLVKLLAADVEASLGAKIRIKDGHLGGKLECRDAAPIQVMGGNIDVMDADLTGQGSINVMHGGQVNVMGGDIHVMQGGNIVIGDSGKLVMMGGQVIYVNSNVAPIALEYPILETLGGTNQITYATGDTLFASATDTLAKLPIGASGDVLTVNGSGVPMWTSIPSGPGGTVTSVTAGSGLDVGAGPGGSITAAGTLNIAPLGVTNAMLAGTITNAKLQNSSVTVTAGSGLSGGGAVSLGGATTLSIPASGITNAMLQNSSVTVTAGSGLSGGGAVSLGGTTTLSIPASGVTNAMLAGGITNANLQNSSVTVTAGTGLTGGGTVTLGGTTTVSLSLTPSVTNLTITGPVNNSMFAATKQYVDAAVAALNVHEPVYVATTSATSLNSGGMPPTYLNGVMGVGATLTAFAVNTPLIVDGYTFIASDVTNATRILVKDQLNQQHNGIYTFSQLQTAIAPWILTRATDADNSPAGELKNGDFNFVQSGTANASTGWVEICVGTGPGDEIIIGTDNICYAQISGAGTYSAGAGLNLSGTIFSVATGGVTNAMLAGGITNTNLQNSSITVTAGTGLTGGGAVSLGGTTTLNIGTVPVANGGTGITSYTAGDILYATGATTLAKLVVGSSGQTLTVSAGLLPVWTTPAATGVTNIATGTGLTGGPITTTGTISLTNVGTAGTYGQVTTDAQGRVTSGGTNTAANGGTGITSYAVGDILYATGATTLTKLVIGSSGQTLTVSAGLLPVWTTPAAGGTVTNVATGAGLTGGPITTTGTISIATGGVTNAMLVNSSVTVTAGTGLTGGGAVSLGGTTTINLSNVGTAGTYGQVTTDAQGRVTSGATNTAANGGTGITSYAVGDTLYATGATTLSKLTIGTAGSVISSVSGSPAWSLPTVNIFATPTIYSTPGTFTFTTDSRVSYYRVNMWGGGGGGYNISPGFAGTGGSGGGFLSFVFRNCNLSSGQGVAQTVTLVVGAGGASAIGGGSAGGGGNTVIIISGVGGSAVAAGGSGGSTSSGVGGTVALTISSVVGASSSASGGGQSGSTPSAGSGAGGMSSSVVGLFPIVGQDGSVLPLSLGMTLIGGQGGGNSVGDGNAGNYLTGIGGNGGKTAFYATAGGSPGGGGGGSFQYPASGAAGAVIFIPYSYSSIV